MRNFKFIDQNTWEITKISAKTKTNAIKEFKHLKNNSKLILDDFVPAKYFKKS